MVEIQFLDYDIPNAIVPVNSLNSDKVTEDLVKKNVWEICYEMRKKRH